MRSYLKLRTALLAILAIAVGLPSESRAFGSSSGSDPEAPLPIAQQGYELVKNWQFGRTVRTIAELRDEFYTRYVYDGGRTDTLPSNGEWQRYRDNDNHRLHEGSLSLVAHLRGGLRRYGIESGMLRSKWTGKYGYFECRIKVPSGRGFWPACWLNPQDEKHPPEIDIVEIVNNGRVGTYTSFHFVHTGNGIPAKLLYSRLGNAGEFRNVEDYADGFHTFAVEWTDQRVRHFVDNVLVADREFQWQHSDGSDGGDAHFLLNLAVGGNWPGPPTNEADFPAELKVEYIRIWQKKKF